MIVIFFVEEYLYKHVNYGRIAMPCPLNVLFGFILKPNFYFIFPFGFILNCNRIFLMRAFRLVAQMTLLRRTA